MLFLYLKKDLRLLYRDLFTTSVSWLFVSCSTFVFFMFMPKESSEWYTSFFMLISLFSSLITFQNFFTIDKEMGLLTTLFLSKKLDYSYIFAKIAVFFICHLIIHFPFAIFFLTNINILFINAAALSLFLCIWGPLTLKSPPPVLLFTAVTIPLYIPYIILIHTHINHILPLIGLLIFHASLFIPATKYLLHVMIKEDL